VESTGSERDIHEPLGLCPQIRAKDHVESTRPIGFYYGTCYQLVHVSAAQKAYHGPMRHDRNAPSHL
jgi:hypothetical protein